MPREFECWQKRMGHRKHSCPSDTGRRAFWWKGQAWVLLFILGIDFSTTHAEGFENGNIDLIRLQPLPPYGMYSPVVTSLAASHDGKWLVAAGDDHAIRIVERSTGRLLKLLEGHTDWVQSVKLLEESRTILSCSNDGTLRAWSSNGPDWNTATDWSSRVLYQGPVALLCLAITPDEKSFAIGGFGNTVAVRDISSGDLIKEFICECSDQRTLAFSRDGRQLACGGRDGVLRVWFWTESVQDSAQPLEQKLHDGRIRMVSFSEDGTIVTTIAEDRRLIRYRIREGQVLLDQKITGGKLMAMTAIDSRLIAIAGADNTIRILDAECGREIHRLIGHDGSVAVLILSGDELISSSYDTTIRFWRLTKATQQDSSPYEHPVSARYVDSGVSDSIR